MRRLWLILKRLVRRILGLNDSPHAIAIGASAGVFIAFMPLYGFQMILGAGLAAVVRGNKIAGALPAWLTNPVTIPPVLYAQYLLGTLFVAGGRPEKVWPKIQEVGRAAGNLSLTDWKNTSRNVMYHVKDLGWDVLWPTLLGCFISSVILGLITYPLTVRAVVWFRFKREAIRERRRLRLAAYRAGAGGAEEADRDDPTVGRLRGLRARRAAESTRLHPPVGEEPPPGP
jgi:hypothetical protein